MAYAKVIIEDNSKLDTIFTYEIGEEFSNVLVAGMRVLVEFGRGNKLVVGLLLGIDYEYDGKFQLKKIIDVLDSKPIIDGKFLELALFMRGQYLCTYREAINPILPPGNYKSVDTIIDFIDLPENIDMLIEEEKLIINTLKEKERCSLKDLKEIVKVSKLNYYIKKLESLGIIRTYIDISTSVMKKTERWVFLKDKQKNLEELLKIVGGRGLKQREIIKKIYKEKEILLSRVIKDLNTTLSTVKSLEKKDLIYFEDKEIIRTPVKKPVDYYEKHKLNLEQEEVYNIIKLSYKNKIQNKFLLQGITGSGKTEVYLQLVEDMLRQGKESIILVPEISLTPQTIRRFMGRFGDNVAILHSRLSQGERFDQWRRIKEGQVKIAIGARSAIFAPFNNLGIIIIDEEHESTYKSGQNPKYDTIEVASFRSDKEDAILLLGTATPSLNSYYKCKKGQFTLLNLQNRANKMDLPEIKVVDMREELKNGNKSIFSYLLYQNILESLKKKEQIILFLNRRGYSTFISCRECGHVMKCESCDISLTYYKDIDRLKCNYCGLTVKHPSTCPICNSKYIKHFGIGTEQVERLTRDAFPNAKIERMDGDTTSKKNSHEKILEKMYNKEVDILIGTQMISKGLDFENVTLVGIIAGDITLNLPDYSSPEKNFQLITQVAGRAGRGEKEGNVILQTYNPDHYSIIYAKEHDYEGFYRGEIKLRESFLYPPFIDLINILVYGEDKYRVYNLVKEIYNILGKEVYSIYKGEYKNYIIGPYPSPLEKIKNNYRYNIIMKVEKVYLEDIKKIIYDTCIRNEKNLKMKDLKISIDINPSNIL